MIFLAVLVGSIAMAVLSPVPVIGPIIAGFVAGVIAGGLGRGALAGFLSGTIDGIVAGLLLTSIGGLLGGLLGGSEGAGIGGLLGMVLGGGVFLSTLYFGLLGLAGGVVGGLLRRPRGSTAAEGRSRKAVVIALVCVGLIVVAVTSAVVLVLPKVSSLRMSESDTESTFAATRFAEKYTERLEKLSQKASELRGDPTMAANLATFDSIYAVAQASVTEIRGITDEKAGRAKREEMDDQWRAMKRLLKQGGGYSDE